MERRTFIATVGTGVTVGLAGCLDAGGDPTGENEVGMTIDSFRPEELVVEPGTTVTFINTSSHAHTVTAFQDAYPEEAEFWSSGDFDTEKEAIEGWNRNNGGALFAGDEFEHTFEHIEDGESSSRYDYYCIPHYVPHQGTEMRGYVIVEE